MIEALIAAAAAIVVCLLNNIYMDRRRRVQMETDMAILKATLTAEIKSLTVEVEKHNMVIERVYHLETAQEVTDEKLKVVNHRLDDLERITA